MSHLVRCFNESNKNVIDDIRIHFVNCLKEKFIAKVDCPFLPYLSEAQRHCDMQAKSSCDVVTTPVSATSSNGSILERGSHMVKSGLRDDNFFSLLPNCTSLYTVGRPLSREVLFCFHYGYQVGSTVAPVSAHWLAEHVKNT